MFSNGNIWLIKGDILVNRLIQNMLNYSFKMKYQKYSMSCTVIIFSQRFLCFGANIRSSRCFCPSAKTKPLHLQATKNTMSGSFSSPKPESSTSKKIITPLFTTTTPAASLHPAPPPATPLVPVVRPRGAPREVLKPVVLAFPANFFPLRHSQTRFSPSFNYNRWRSPAQTASHLSRSSAALSKDAMF